MHLYQSLSGDTSDRRHTCKLFCTSEILHAQMILSHTQSHLQSTLFSYNKFQIQTIFVIFKLYFSTHFLQTIFATLQLSFKLVSFINDLHYHHSSVFKLVSLTNDLHYSSSVFKRVSYTNVLLKNHSKNLCYHSTVF